MKSFQPRAAARPLLTMLEEAAESCRHVYCLHLHVYCLHLHVHCLHLYCRVLQACLLPTCVLECVLPHV